MIVTGIAAADDILERLAIVEAGWRSYTRRWRPLDPSPGRSESAGRPIVHVRAGRFQGDELLEAELCPDRSPGRPGVRKVIYTRSRTAAWVAVKRITDLPAEPVAEQRVEVESSRERSRDASSLQRVSWWQSGNGHQSRAHYRWPGEQRALCRAPIPDDARPPAEGTFRGGCVDCERRRAALLEPGRVGEASAQVPGPSRSTSTPSTGDASRPDPAAAAAVPARGPGAPCDWCGQPIPEFTEQGRRTRADAEVCGVVHRKARWRFAKAVPRSSPRVPAAPGVGAPGWERPLRFAYADPPYPGKAAYYPERTEVDHAQLIARLVGEFPDGWALSTSAAALQRVLALCPDGVRVCVWRRAPRLMRSRRAINAFEPLIVHGGRPLATTAPQRLLDVLDYRGRYGAFPGALIGMKPPEFAVWMFALLGAAPADELVDLFPGSGVIARAWERYASRTDSARTFAA